MSRLAKNMDEQCHYGLVEGNHGSRCQYVGGHEGPHKDSLGREFVSPTPIEIDSKREQARKEFDTLALELCDLIEKKRLGGSYHERRCRLGIRKAADTLGLLPPTCTCDRTGWPGSASPELHEVNCPARKDERKS